MKKETILTWISVVLALAAASLFFLDWNPENLLRQEETPVTLSDIKEDQTTAFTGSEAGGDIPRLTGAADFSEILNYSDYVTAEPIGIVPTDVYSLKAWVSPYRNRIFKGRASTGSRRAEVRRGGFAVGESYNQYYLLELPDRSYILAQIPQAQASAIADGESVTLPMGQKVGMTNTARSYLSDICQEYGADMNGVLYTFDDGWQEEKHFTLFILRFGAAALLFLVLAVALLLIGNKIFQRKDK